METDVFVVELDAPIGDRCGVLIRQVEDLDDEATVDHGSCITVIEYGRAAAAAYMTTPALGSVLGLSEEEQHGNVITDEMVATLRELWGLE